MRRDTDAVSSVYRSNPVGSGTYEEGVVPVGTIQRAKVCIRPAGLGATPDLTGWIPALYPRVWMVGTTQTHCRAGLYTAQPDRSPLYGSVVVRVLGLEFGARFRECLGAVHAVW